MLDQRIGTPRAKNDGFRFVGLHSMSGDVLFIPVIPAELHAENYMYI